MSRASLFVLSIVVPVFFLSCKNDVPKHVARVKVHCCSASSSASSLSYTGTVCEGASASLSFEFLGTVSNVYVNEGDKVRRGQPLASLDATALRSAYESALALENQAQDAIDRLSTLRNKKAVADVQWVDLQTKLTEAKSMVQAAKEKLSRCTLTAPFDGVVSKRAVDVGQAVVPGIESFHVVNINSLKFVVEVPEKDFVRVGKGTPARICVAALGGRAYDSSVSDRSPFSSNVSHTFTVSIDVDNSDNALYPGMICDVTFDLSSNSFSDSDSSRITLPAKVIMLTENNDHYVWVARDDSYAQRRFVTLGESTPDGLVVTSGLSSEDKVITDGYLRLSEGCAVSIVE